MSVAPGRGGTLATSQAEHGARAEERATPLVVQYLYVHGVHEQFLYPSSRSHSGSGERLAARYLECVLVQAASLRLLEADCSLALVTNLEDARTLGRRGTRLLAEIESLDVEIVHADYLHRPSTELRRFASSRYVFDAILAVGDGAPDRQLWLVDVDCLWLDPPKVFAAAPAPPGIGCLHIGYPPDWLVSGITPRALGELARRLGAHADTLRWVGGELLAGRAGDLRRMVSTCDQLEQELAALGEELATEEQLLSLAGALDRVEFHDLAGTAARIWTGPRHQAAGVSDPASLGLCHLPSEKGLAFRRAARAVSSGHRDRLRRDLEVPARALKRFNVRGAGWTRRVRDDTWLATQRLGDAVLSRLPSLRP